MDRSCYIRCFAMPLALSIFIALLAHDHQRCLALLLLVLYFSHHLQQGVNWGTALPWPGDKVEQSHLMEGL